VAGHYPAIQNRASESRLRGKCAWRRTSRAGVQPAFAGLLGGFLLVAGCSSQSDDRPRLTRAALRHPGPGVQRDQKGGTKGGACGYVAAKTDPSRNAPTTLHAPRVPRATAKPRCVRDASSTCDVDGVTRLSAAGERTNCLPYRCVAGACGTQCASAADGSTGAHCTAEERCERAQSNTAAPNDSGCGCHFVGNAKAQSWHSAGFVFDGGNIQYASTEQLGGHEGYQSSPS